MHYYKFDVSAWWLHTAHLTLEEEAVYLRLVNLYYDTEQPIPVETQTVSRRLRLGNDDIVKSVLAEFFTLTDEGWRNKRCDEELAAFHAKAERNRVVGRLGGRPRKETQMVSKENPQETQTINYKLETNKKKNRASAVAECPADVGQQVWNDFVQVRKAKRAPLTETALASIRKEADRAGWSLEQALRECSARGWQGFKADWVASAPKTPPSGNVAAARAIFGDERKLSDARTIDTKTLT